MVRGGLNEGCASVSSLALLHARKVPSPRPRVHVRAIAGEDSISMTLGGIPASCKGPNTTPAGLIAGCGIGDQPNEW